MELDTLDKLEQTAAMRARLEGTNINQKTFLATDYLNHFNEIVMLFEMVPDMPDILEECREWAPKSYTEHFADSSFSDKDLAIEAYELVPAEYKEPFEETIDHLNRLVYISIDRMDEAIQGGDADILQAKAQAASRALQRLMDYAGGIIYGTQSTMQQDEIDLVFGF